MQWFKTQNESFEQSRVNFPNLLYTPCRNWSLKSFLPGNTEADRKPGVVGIYLIYPWMQHRSSRDSLSGIMCIRQDLKGKSYHTQIRIIWKEFIYKRDWLPRCVRVVLVGTQEGKKGRNLELTEASFQHPQSWMDNGKEILPESRRDYLIEQPPRLEKWPSVKDTGCARWNNRVASRKTNTLAFVSSHSLYPSGQTKLEVIGLGSLLV